MNVSLVPKVTAVGGASSALLKLAGLNLVLPQSEVRAVEAAADVDTAEPELHSVGWINYAQQRWPVYCLSEELAPLSRIPAQHRTCVLLALGAGYMGILCDDVSITQQITMQRSELPAAMRLPGSPILGLFALNDGIACISDARHLAAYIDQVATG